MNTEVDLKILKRKRRISIEELYEDFPITQHKELIRIADFISSISVYCPTRHLRVDYEQSYTYIELDNCTIFIFNPNKIRITKQSLSFETNLDKALEFLENLNSGYPYSFPMFRQIQEIVPRLVSNSSFYLTKIGNSLTIEYK